MVAPCHFGLASFVDTCILALLHLLPCAFPLPSSQTHATQRSSLPSSHHSPTVFPFFLLCCVLLSSFLIVFVSSSFLSQNSRFCFQLLFSDFGFSCSAFVSSILDFPVGILFDIFVFSYYSPVLVFPVKLLFRRFWFLLWGSCLTFLFSVIILRFWVFLFSFGFVDFGFCCGDFVWHFCFQLLFSGFGFSC